MSFLDVDLKSNYDSEEDDILNGFYIPLLAKSKSYDRLAGFFSSSALAIAARGIAPFIENGGAMRLIVGAALQKSDVEAIRLGKEAPERILLEVMLKNLDEIYNELVRDHVRALAWLVARNQLEIKVAVVTDNRGYPLDQDTATKRGIFHQKVGILKDAEGNVVSFSGSINESAAAWEDNIEEFKVFRSWIDGEKDHLAYDKSKFEKYWLGKTSRVKIMDVPEAVRERLIKIAPRDIKELRLERFYKEPGLRNYQIEAVSNWLGNEKKGIFEMATGTGKTITALTCVKKIFETENRVVVIISSPFIHLSEQWIKESYKLNINCDKLVADSSQSRWKDKLVDGLFDVENGVNEKLMILTTHNTFSIPDFMTILKRSKERVPGERLLLIVDEVHGIGAPERRKGLMEEYDYRLGLSATPKRWFDLEGTDIIFDYFKDVVFEFSLKDAIDAGFLTPYIYKPHFTYLTSDEMKRYEFESRKIARAYHRSKDEEEKDEIFSLLCIKRQKIIRNASNKFQVYEKILDELPEIKYCLIYCSPQQIRRVQDILNKRNIIQHKFTQYEGTRAEKVFEGLSEREFLLKKFSEGVYQALVSMKCLDEGVDVPPARVAIMLDNSGNPREYIQRRGRVLRKFPGKKYAVIHDIIVEPILRPQISPELGDLERKIIAKELQRYRDFANSSQNASECLRIMENVESLYGL